MFSMSDPTWSLTQLPGRPGLSVIKNILEKVQRKAVGMVSVLTGRDYEARLKELGLQMLEERHHQADMCTVYKIMHGQGGIQYRSWFEKASDSESDNGGCQQFKCES